MGATFASFQSFGTWPVCNDLLNIISSIGEIWWLNSFRTVGGIVSGPAALWGFRLDRICPQSGTTPLTVSGSVKPGDYFFRLEISPSAEGGDREGGRQARGQDSEDYKEKHKLDSKQISNSPC